MSKQRDEHDSEAGVQVFEVRMTVGPPHEQGREDTAEPLSREGLASVLANATAAEAIAGGLEARHGYREVSLSLADPRPAEQENQDIPPLVAPLVEQLKQAENRITSDLRGLASQIRRREEAMRVPPVGALGLLDTLENVTTCLGQLGDQISSGRFDAAKDWVKQCSGAVVKEAREVAGRARGAS